MFPGFCGWDFFSSQSQSGPARGAGGQDADSFHILYNICRIVVCNVPPVRDTAGYYITDLNTTLRISTSQPRLTHSGPNHKFIL